MKPWATLKLAQVWAEDRTKEFQRSPNLNSVTLKKNRGWGDWEVAAMSLVIGFCLLVLESGVKGRRFLSMQRCEPTHFPAFRHDCACSHLSVSQLLSKWPLNKWAGPAREPFLMSTTNLWPLLAAVSPWLMSRRCLCSPLMLWGLLLPSFDALSVQMNA